MENSGVTPKLLTWGETKGSNNLDIPSGGVIATTPVKGEPREPDWWLDAGNAVWLQRLKDTLGEFRKRSLRIDDANWWDVLVDFENEKVNIIDLESCTDHESPKKLSYAHELDDILQNWDPYKEMDFGYYTGPLENVDMSNY
ncbi:hypothetical protein ABW20_dc0101996 [Dactylellina cionopaga]|nr:hypothetical protein ABW20_dc0101996 [Dactylellina cionopaga]